MSSETAASSREAQSDTHNADYKDNVLRIAIIGAGTIGLSFTGLHLSHPANRDGGRKVEIRIYDPRPELREYVERTLPGKFPGVIYYIFFFSKYVLNVNLLNRIPVPIPSRKYDPADIQLRLEYNRTHLSSPSPF